MVIWKIREKTKKSSFLDRTILDVVIIGMFKSGLDYLQNVSTFGENCKIEWCEVLVFWDYQIV